MEQRGRLFAMSAVGGGPREIRLPSDSSIERQAPPQWSADGTEIAVAVRRPTGKAIAIVSLESFETRYVSIPPHEGNLSVDLSWSPDGQTFAYVDSVNDAEVTRLWLIPSAGGEATPVTDGRTNVLSPRWSADGRRLFFASNRGGAMDLWEHRVGADGKPEGEPVALTHGMGIRWAAFSPDGSKLAYSRGRRVKNVWRVPILSDRVATWADAQQITFDTAFVELMDLSPDGSRLVMSSDRAGNRDLWILPAQGGEMTRLTTDPTPDWGPSWSPDGTEIAFHAYRSGNRDIWVMPSNGGPARQLTTHPNAKSHSFRVEGAKPTFGSWTREVESHARWQQTLSVYHIGLPMVAQSSSCATRKSGECLRPAARRSAISRGPSGQARWAPDGELIYYVGRGEHSDRLWALSPSDGQEYVVADLSGRWGRLAFEMTTDGSNLYFAWRADIGEIWVMDIITEEQ